jgi:hypothetical protein
MPRILGHDASMTEALAPRVRNAILAMCACLVPMFWGVIAKQWFAAGPDNVGLVGIEQCPLLCEVKQWKDLHPPFEISLLGYSAFLGGLNAFGFACHGIAMLLKGSFAKLRYKWIVWLSVITVIASVGFLLRLKLGSGGSELGLAYPGFLAIAGSAALVVVMWKMVAPLRLST